MIIIEREKGERTAKGKVEDRSGKDIARIMITIWKEVAKDRNRQRKITNEVMGPPRPVALICTVFVILRLPSFTSISSEHLEI